MALEFGGTVFRISMGESRCLCQSQHDYFGLHIDEQKVSTLAH